MLEKIKTIDVHGLIPRNGHNLTKGGTTTNVGVLGMQAAESGAVINCLGNVIVGKMCVLGPIQNLVVHFLGEMIVNNERQQSFIAGLESGVINNASLLWERWQFKSREMRWG